MLSVYKYLGDLFYYYTSQKITTCTLVRPQALVVI